MPLLPSVSDTVAPATASRPKPDKVASIAKAREAQAVWAELAHECDQALAEVKAQLAALRVATDDYVRFLATRPLLARRDKKALVSAASALVHLDACIARVKERETRQAKRDAERAAKRASSVQKREQPRDSRVGGNKSR